MNAEARALAAVIAFASVVGGPPASAGHDDPAIRRWSATAPEARIGRYRFAGLTAGGYTEGLGPMVQGVDARLQLSSIAGDRRVTWAQWVGWTKGVRFHVDREAGTVTAVGSFRGRLSREEFIRPAERWTSISWSTRRATGRLNVRWTGVDLESPHADAGLTCGSAFFVPFCLPWAKAGLHRDATVEGWITFDGLGVTVRLDGRRGSISYDVV